MQIQIDPQRVDLRKEADQVLQRPTEPINRPGHDQIKLALGGIAVLSNAGRLSRPLEPLMPWSL
jgi:hypothetical protein